MDERRRRLERAAAQGDREAEAQLLGERLRLGEVARDRVELAARLGDPRARDVLGDDAPPPDLHLASWLASLGSKALGARALLALARWVVPAWDAAFPHAREPRNLLTALEVAAEAPGDPVRWAVAQAAHTELEDARERVRLVTDVIGDAAERRLPTLAQVEARALDSGRRVAWQTALVRLGTRGEDVLARVARACGGPQGEGGLQLLVATSLIDELEVVDLLLAASWMLDPQGVLDDWTPHAARLAQRVARREGAPAVRETVAAALVPFLLQ